MKYENISINKKEGSLVEITGDVPNRELLEYRGKALKEISNQADIDGFRKGHVPENIIIKKFGEMYILEEGADLILKDIVPEIVEKNAPSYIGRPKISITKLAPGNTMSFSITIAVRPDIVLPEYKKIATEEMLKKENVPATTEKEINEVIERVRSDFAHHEFHKKENGDKNVHDHNHSKEDMDKFKPEITDEFVKKIGDFRDINDFRMKIKENLQKEKEQRSIEKRRGKILDTLIAGTKIDVPEILVNHEIDRLFSQFESEISGMGIKMEDYLKHIKKTPENLRNDWLPEAKKRATLTLILEDIALKEKILPDAESVQHEIKHLIEHNKDIDKVRAEIFVTHALTLEKVIQFLEKQK